MKLKLPDGAIRQPKTAKPIYYYALSFLLPLLLCAVALADMGVTPFGDKTLIISDADNLYVNYLGYTGRLLKGTEGFIYSFEKGLGGNMMPHMGGTMLNPAFFLIALFDVVDYPLAFTFISVLNFCLCGLSMYILLAALFGHGRGSLLFSTTYALSGFMVANVFQIIFFTGPMMLPLMVLGLWHILHGRNPLLYILSLGFCLLTNAYFGFTLCVASVMLFFVYLWMKKDKLHGQKLRIFIHYAIASLCAGLLAIIIWLPTILGIRGGRLDQTSLSDFSFGENMPFLEIFSKLFTGANSTSELMDGLPNIFVGLLPVSLVVLFFMNRSIEKRIKFAAGFLLSIYLVSFFIVAFDMLMHAGTTTNWFNYRYSYVFSFLLLLIAAYEWQYFDEFPLPDLKRCYMGLLIAALLVFIKHYTFVNGGEVLLDFALLGLVFLAYLLHKHKPQFNPKRTFELVTLFVACFSLFLNYMISTENIMEWGIKESDFQKTVSAVAPLVSAAQKADPSFYRMEVNNQRSGNSGNDPMLYGYNGVGHGGSNERNFVRTELNKLGVQWFDMRNSYAQGIPAATDTLLGIRFFISDEDASVEKDYLRITSMAEFGLAEEGAAYDLYCNEYALPIAFVSENAVNELSLTRDDLFDNLNQVWRTISGTEDDVFTEEDEISFQTLNLAASQSMDASEAREIISEYKSNNSETVSETDSSESSSSGDDGLTVHLIMDEAPQFSSSIEFSFTAAQDGAVYVYHRTALSDSSGSGESVVKYMGTYQKGETVKGYLYTQGDYVNRIVLEEYAGRFRAAYAETETLQKLSAMVRERPSTVEAGVNGHMTGTFTAEEGQELLFTVPWDEGWTCYIDGQEAPLTKVLGVFMAAQAAPGAHTFEMKYSPAGLDIGIKISIGTLIFLLLYLLFGRKWLDRLFAKRREAKELTNADENEAKQIAAAAESPDLEMTASEAVPESAEADAPADEAQKEETPDDPV